MRQPPRSASRPENQNIEDLAAEISSENLAEADSDWIFYTSYGTPEATGEKVALDGPIYYKLEAVKAGHVQRSDRRRLVPGPRPYRRLDRPGRPAHLPRVVATSPQHIFIGVGSGFGRAPHPLNRRQVGSLTMTPNMTPSPAWLEEFRRELMAGLEVAAVHRPGGDFRDFTVASHCRSWWLILTAFPPKGPSAIIDHAIAATSHASVETVALHIAVCDIAEPGPAGDPIGCSRTLKRSPGAWPDIMWSGDVNLFSGTQ